MGRILLVEDDDLARGYFRRLLEGAGHSVVEAADGGRAVRTFREGGIDLVVTDIFLPVMSGLDALVEMDPKSAGVPVIALPGGGQGTGAYPLELARSLGASAVFLKPFDVPAFLAAVGELLRKGPREKGPE